MDSGDRTTQLDSPSSEVSVYFDAPLMHFFSKKPKNPDSPAAPSSPSLQQQNNDNSDNSLPRQPEQQINRHPSLTFVRDGGAPEGQTLAAATQDSNSNDSGYESTKPQRYQLADPGPVSDQPPQQQQQHAQRRDTDDDDEADTDMKPIPILWSPNNNGSRTPTQNGLRVDSPAKRSQSMRSLRSAAVADRDTDRNSIRTSASTYRRRRQSINGGGFASGAGTVGPAATLNVDLEAFQARSAQAEAGLSERQKSKLMKNSVRDGKQVAKVVKEEAKVEKKALDAAIRELAEIQRMQKDAVKEESKAYTNSARILRKFHKEELIFMAARAQFERAQAELQAAEDAREAARNHATEATEMLQEKNKEVEWLRAQKDADDRERAAKLLKLAGKA